MYRRHAVLFEPCHDTGTRGDVDCIWPQNEKKIAFYKPSRQTETFESYMVLKQVRRGGPLCRWATRRAASAHHVVISAAKDETGHLQNAGRELPCQP